jgi:hypothetical protein
MFLEQIANFGAQLISEMAAPSSSMARAGPEVGGSTSGEFPRDVDIDQETRTKPYVPANNERLSESSLHLSC